MVPAKQGIGLDDEQGARPRSEPARQQHQQGSVGVAELWSGDLTAQDNQLLAQQGILHYEFLPTTTKVHNRASRKRMTGWPFPNPADKAALECREDKHHQELKETNQNEMPLHGKNAER
ncbi:MAG: hypothetical protein ABI670_20380 [Chloroflexota bacterium]